MAPPLYISVADIGQYKIRIGIPVEKAVKNAIQSFTGLAHHIELVSEIDSVLYYDDSFSSNPTATKVAVKSFKNPIILILGGFDKGIDMSPLKDFLNQTENIKKILLIGQIREKLSENLQKEYEIMNTKNFKKIIKRAREIAEPGDIVLLSPGTASFGMFKNFYDRGEQFQKIVRGMER